MSTQASEVGVRVLQAGGNAVDAAVATTFAIGVTRPDMCGIGGGGFLVYRGADGTVETLDFREQAPQHFSFVRGLVDPAYAYGSPGQPAVRFGLGHQVVGVPGTVAGLVAIRDRYGTLPLAELVEPAAQLADGFVVTDELSSFMNGQWYDLGVYFPETRRTYLKHGLLPYSPGDVMSLPDYARSLRLIAEGGSDAFYRGEIAQAIVKEMESSRSVTNPYRDDAGTLSLEDLASYEAIWRAPITTSYRGHQIFTAPAPTSGGIAAVEMLNILRNFELGPEMPQADRLHLLAEAQKIAWADRNAYVGDPRFSEVPQETLTSAHYGRRRASEIDLTLAGTYEPGLQEPDGVSSVGGGMHTTHVSVIDAAGNAVALTCSVEQPFGSHVVAPGTGFVLNNTMTDFDDPLPGEDAANAPGSSKRPRSSQTPVIVVKDDQPIAVLGAAGGPAIPMAVLNTVVNTIDLDMGLAQAVDSERTDACGFSSGCSQLYVEDARLPATVLDDLISRGHDIVATGEYDLWGAIVQAAGVVPSSEQRLATSDPRSEWGALAQ